MRTMLTRLRDAYRRWRYRRWHDQRIKAATKAGCSVTFLEDPSDDECVLMANHGVPVNVEILKAMWWPDQYHPAICIQWRVPKDVADTA